MVGKFTVVVGELAVVVGELAKVVGAGVVTSVMNMVWLVWFVTVLRRKIVSNLLIFCIHHRASCFIFRIMLNMALFLRVVNEGDHVVVN